MTDYQDQGMQRGMVSLVGAGPGDPGLLTLRGLERLQEADVVLYDALIPAGILSHCPPGAEMIFVGKKAGAHLSRQAEINDLLVTHAQAGKRVVRLKGGDPMVFGRGGEEALVLADAGIPFECVPGVTSASAAPAYAGIPVTHRQMASSFTVITGHEDPAKAGSSHDWAKLARSGDTLVFFMAWDNLREIMAQLIAHGVPRDRSACVIQRGTCPDQRTIVGTVADIADRAADIGFRSPTLFVVGEVVALRQKLRWFDTRPLFGKRIVVTRARHQAAALSDRIRAVGGMPLECPLLRFVAPDNWDDVDAALADLHTFDWIVFTSVNAVDFFFQRFFAGDRDIRDLGPARICAIGPATARQVTTRGLTVALQPDEYIAESLAAALSAEGDVKGLRFLLPQADIARETVATMLEAEDADVQEVVVYRTVPETEINPAMLEDLRTGAVDMLTFASSSAVRYFADLAERENFTDAITTFPVACIGPMTSQTARERGFTVTVEADDSTIPGLVNAIVTFFQ